VVQKTGTVFVRLNFTKYQPIFKIISLSDCQNKETICNKDPTTPQHILRN